MIMLYCDMIERGLFVSTMMVLDKTYDHLAVLSHKQFTLLNALRQSWSKHKSQLMAVFVCQALNGI